MSSRRGHGYGSGGGSRYSARRNYRYRRREYKRRRRNGWGMGLYRNTRDGKVAGVCAGIADHWEVEHWVVRLLAIVLFLFTGTLALWAYLFGWVVLAPRRRRDEPEDDAEEVEMEYDERSRDYRPRRMFRYGESPGVRLRRAKERLDAALGRVEDMETYVTSRRYRLEREFSKL